MNGITANGASGALSLTKSFVAGICRVGDKQQGSLSIRRTDRQHGAVGSGSSGEPTVARAQRAVQPFGQGDIARVVSSDVGAQFEGSMHEAARGYAVNSEISEVSYRLFESLVGRGADKPPTTQNRDRLHIDKIGCGQFLVFSQDIAA